MRGHVRQTNAALRDHSERLTALEIQLSAGATISETQAAELARAVKNVAPLLEQRGTANPYQQVWGELYRRFRVGPTAICPARAMMRSGRGWLGGMMRCKAVRDKRGLAGHTNI